MVIVAANEISFRWAIDIAMHKLKYVRFSKVDPDSFIELLNKQKIREHLIEHDFFDSISIMDWVEDKIEMDSKKGCRVRGIISEKRLAGWCGIQLEKGQFEIAIVIDENYWGIGKPVFNDIMRWARELGHEEIYIHFLDTRPEYKFLKKIAEDVYETEHFGRKFTTYKLLIK